MPTFFCVRRLTLFLALLALPAAAKVKRPTLSARAQIRAPHLQLPPQALSSRKAAVKTEPPPVKLEPPAERVLDGLTLVQLDGSEGLRRIVLKPDFRGGPGASFSVKF